MNEKLVEILKFNDQGLIPAIAQQHDTGEILMMAWMNLDAIQETLKTGQVCYWSRSRSALWRKGESSGHIQTLKDFRVDCDGDTILLQVHQEGVACHTGRRNCFFYSVEDDTVSINSDVIVAPEDMYKK
ncbi:phosphoribosyl-AMP cyclohydrolase [Sneathiella sp.]|jgi:phosphoribosyl-AMP cyclohydrolase|uniref:phosphoribosyl-AMP cyclohydrolase n=1 Tax=Sneathiella sp. TaxID=1964365 RepID=UPI0039E216D5